ncbi:hypothetical protein [Streptomyces sp. NBC_00203]|uniref:hypothetical protein n=1 Tax=Streptomyces sp. NBC_00203 TaxID=2975680 RepID=UPI00324C546C
MSIQMTLLVLALAMGAVIALISGIAAGVLSWLAGTHPAGSIVRGGATFVGVLVMEVAVLTLFWTVSNGVR